MRGSMNLSLGTSQEAVFLHKIHINSCLEILPWLSSTVDCNLWAETNPPPQAGFSRNVFTAVRNKPGPQHPKFTQPPNNRRYAECNHQCNNLCTLFVKLLIICSKIQLDSPGIPRREDPGGRIWQTFDVIFLTADNDGWKGPGEDSLHRLECSAPLRYWGSEGQTSSPWPQICSDK